MSLIRTVMLMLPSFSLGAVLVGMFGLPLAYRRGRLRTEDETRLFEGVALARDHKPAAIAAEASQIPIGAEPADGRSGLTSPAAAGAAVTAARTSGNAAPPLDAPNPAARRWSGRATLERLDRLASNRRLDPLCAFLGRHERRWVHHYELVPARRTEPAAAILARLAIEHQTGLLPVLAEHGKPKPPPIDYSAYSDHKVTAPAVLGLTDEGPIPVATIGELVAS